VAAYRAASGAQAQKWHRDDGVLDSRLASVQIALAPTQAEQGALEVLPASHTHDERPAAAGAPDPQGVSIAVPAGTVVFYSPNLVHRGRANRLSEERLAVTINVMGALTLTSPLPPPPRAPIRLTFS
tara:strand:- start:1645 stop:2025 length:381 start_codon:yes stop_codon:yes gene_type:complete